MVESKDTVAVATSPRSGRSHAAAVLFQFSLLFLTSALYVAIILIAVATKWAQASSSKSSALSAWLEIDVGTTITVVRILQGLLTGLSSVVFTRTLLYLKWGLVQKSGPVGLPYRTLLAMSPTTLGWGTIRLIFGPGSGFWTRFWALARYFPSKPLLCSSLINLF
jgi:hypothetical protein